MFNSNIYFNILNFLKPENKKMKHSIKFFTILAFMMATTVCAFARDRLDIWLDKYEVFIEEVEEVTNKEQYSKYESLKKQKDKLFNEKDKIQEQDGNFTFSQGIRYAALNSRWGICVAAINTKKACDNAADKIEEMKQEIDQEERANKIGNQGKSKSA